MMMIVMMMIIIMHADDNGVLKMVSVVSNNIHQRSGAARHTRITPNILFEHSLLTRSSAWPLQI